ncbi:MAG TPA: DUF3943 domain-containing protein [Methylomirabilota bacterium]|nr:DUF3943 domain-containing protein [Methylomirabilota bacterium]
MSVPSARKGRAGNPWWTSTRRSGIMLDALVRAIAVFLALITLGLAAKPVFAQDLSDYSAADANAWWVWAATEDAPDKKFHLLPDNSEEPRSVDPRDWLGLARDTAFLFTYQAVGAAVLFALPSSVSNWTSQNKDASFEKWWENVQNPRWDDDGWAVNYLGHTYFGATYYTRARERGFGRLDSFVYAAFASALYEFGVEAFFEPPSYQDLIVTPVGGALLGGFVFEPIRDWVKKKPELRWYDHAILIATDPIGALNYLTESLLGIKSDIRVGVPQRGGVFVELRVPWK